MCTNNMSPWMFKDWLAVIKSLHSPQKSVSIKLNEKEVIY